MKHHGLIRLAQFGAIATLLSISFGRKTIVEAQSTPPSTAPTPVVITPGMTIFEDITITPNFTPDPATIRGISGGEFSANQITGRQETSTGPCQGFVDEEPDHTMTLTDFFNYLSIQVESTHNTTLVIQGPGGRWCNDNYQNMNPGIAGQWLSGTYNIWVGSYDEGTYHPYIIEITETR